MDILLLNQSFYPDGAASGLFLNNLAVALSNLGHTVTVVSASRGYDDPQKRFPRRELWNGIRILRVRVLAVDKRTKLGRVVNFASFYVSCCLQFLFLPRQDLVVSMTSPPLICLLGALFTRLKGGRLVIWLMDLNPDEAIAAGVLKENSVTARLLEAVSQYALRKAASIVVLDRFMKDRIVAKGIPEDRISIIPPWSHDDVVGFDPAGRAAFRRQHALEGKYVVMYAGNHSPCHPLDTLLQAALRLRDRPDLVFCFMGGGSEFQKVKRFGAEHNLKSILCLPYQPLDQMSAPLSAADMHVLVMGDAFVGIKHPCKIYNFVALGTDFLFIGPKESHVGDLIAQGRLQAVAHLATHGDTDTVIRHIVSSSARASQAPRRNFATFSQLFSKHVLLPRMIAILESLSPSATSAERPLRDKILAAGK